MCYHFHFWGMSYLTQYVDHTTIGEYLIRLQYLVQGSHTLDCNILTQNVLSNVYEPLAKYCTL